VIGFTDFLAGKEQTPMAIKTEEEPLAVFPPPNVSLPIAGPPVERPDPALVEALQGVSSATAGAVLHKMGIRQNFILGPVSRKPGAKIVGPVVTLQFMPQREDVASGMAQEHVEKQTALWAVFNTVQPGDILAVQEFGDLQSGCMGEMLLTYLRGRGGLGAVVDGCIRDFPKVREMDIPVWTVGVTPNFASQTTLFPWAYNVPIACSRVLVLPGDIIIADDDGAVLVPANLAEIVVERTVEHEEWEVFSRLRLAEGGSIKKYYPLNEEGQQEYEAWRAAQQNGH
jgi:regulator of RNase E activity RraA